MLKFSNSTAQHYPSENAQDESSKNAPFSDIYSASANFKLPRPFLGPSPTGGSLTRNSGVRSSPENLRDVMGSYWYSGDPETVHQLVYANSQPSSVAGFTGTYPGSASSYQSTFKPNSAAIVYDASQNQEFDRLERLKQYEMELRKQKASQDQHNTEQAFLRTSLRTSQRLQALRKSGGRACRDLTNETDPPSPEPQSIASSTDPTECNEIVISFDGSSDDSNRHPGSDSGIIAGPWEHATAYNAAAEVIHCLSRYSFMKAVELRELLSSPNMLALILSHDEVAQCAAMPSVSNLGETSGIKETVLDGSKDFGSVRIVRLIKEEGLPLGATIRSEGGCITIGRVIRGGIVERSGILREGDEILEVNGRNVRGMTVTEACDILNDLSGEIILITIPAPIEDTPDRDLASVRHMRALFDYDPSDDPYLPCRELGMGFNRGDILHVISTKDDNWWQAYKDGEDHPLAGLVPSHAFQLRREQYQRELAEGERDGLKRSNSFLCTGGSGKSKFRKSRIKRSHSSSLIHMQDVPDKILVYEEVCLFVSGTGRKRPVVLVGPPNVGCFELRQRLMQLDKERFGGAVPHTSRPLRANERDGVHYFYIPKAQFQSDVRTHKFVEWGEYQRHYYGTSFEAIRNVVNKGQTCILNLRAQSVEALRKSGLMPYVVFIYPPTLEKLRANRRMYGSLAHAKDDDLKRIIQEAKITEGNWGHLFDKVIVNYDIERTFSELLFTIHRLDTEPQWVPLEWVNSTPFGRTVA